MVLSPELRSRVERKTEDVEVIGESCEKIGESRGFFFLLNNRERIRVKPFYLFQ